ncbi:HAD family hydrolase [Halomarina litorea]|uniref:HAD family hydrolase n=1 Tax=Halomarina litorea TaxID=2961595 RepID=UPI0020C49FB3|nr:HAD family hydrolase [Halomarina sp. BCD28]
MTVPPTAVLFDLDDTLCEHRRTLAERLAAAADHADLALPFDADAVRAAFADVPTAATAHEFYTYLFAAAARRVGGDPSLAPRLATAFRVASDPAAVRFRPGATDALAAVRDRDVAVGLVTNGGRTTQSAKLAALGIEDAFDVRVFATPDRGLKPSAYPFRRALATLDADPARTLYVGNSLRADVTGANREGLRSVWYPTADERTPDPHPAPDHTLDTLADLPALL